MVFVKDFAFISIIVFIGSIILVAQFYNEVSGNIGQAVLLNFLRGKYHRSIKEERIFMFLDMKASTTIAERLGHRAYCAMLKQYFADISQPIGHHRGEIYQYVGDELVLSWS